MIDYFNYLIDYYGWHGDWTLNIVREGMLNFLKSRDLFDIDRLDIIVFGWEKHALTDTNPRSEIYEEIMELTGGYR
uniref:Uncharacterized protein n=1 Tax=Marseillevirus LCMAC201 TaxID=2506605 RepID=A0A481YXP8_9VIRU|nr:MAG: hypothetical protein LCMAC201_05400 [Marseillevirus LCMAC201]